MKSIIIEKNIQSVLEETNTVYSLVCASGQPNMDYAGYACHVSLNKFRSLLNDPELTTERLEYLLRKAARRHAQRDPEGDWSTFMASYISNKMTANQNV
ncbi:MAG: hypothetical protein AB7E85_04760 [Pseudobdellovibrionaceae bacterium]